jgi:hypothetical protein
VSPLFALRSLLVRIDHVIYASADLDVAAARVQAGLGLKAAGGGRHDGLGTHNRIAAGRGAARR